ncbi:hypothetical protein [Sporofaciens musculi]|jgi:hypothetical protein|uniref:hypothetical protein n=1 Tax=Sporofaciens musculi TaxID=2681861 RepID=UPI00258B9973|nr:hypothetical protein [Sporofaciens musculi]
MKTKYIQLPPLPEDLPTELIEMIWLYAKTPKDKRKMFLDFMNENVYGIPENIGKTKLSQLLNSTDKELDPDLSEYAELMKKFLGTLYSQACDTAGFVYQHYCVEGKSLEERRRIQAMT